MLLTNVVTIMTFSEVEHTMAVYLIWHKIQIFEWCSFQRDKVDPNGCIAAELWYLLFLCRNNSGSWFILLKCAHFHWLTQTMIMNKHEQKLPFNHSNATISSNDVIYQSALATNGTCFGILSGLKIIYNISQFSLQKIIRFTSKTNL